MVMGGLLRPDPDDEAADQELHEHPDDEADDDTEEEAAATLCCASTKSLLTLFVAILPGVGNTIYIKKILQRINSSDDVLKDVLSKRD